MVALALLSLLTVCAVALVTVALMVVWLPLGIAFLALFGGLPLVALLDLYRRRRGR